MPAGSAAIAALMVATPIRAQITTDPTNLFGSRGVIVTPSARMAPDGELSVGASFLRKNQHYNLGFQILPWLEGTLRIPACSVLSRPNQSVLIAHSE